MTRGGVFERLARRAFRLIGPLYPRPLRAASAADMERQFLQDAADARRRGWFGVVRMLVVGVPRDILLAHRLCRVDRGAARSHLVVHARADLRHAIRLLVRQPGFAALAVATIAVSVAGVTTVYSVAQAVWFEDLPFPAPDRLVALWSVDRTTTARDQFSIPEYMDYADRTSTLAGIGAYDVGTITLTGQGVTPRRVRASSVSHSLLRVLGARSGVGRVFRAVEDLRSGPDVALVSHAFWRSQLGGDSTLGTDVVLDGVPHDVIGVMPREFVFPASDVEVWRPLREDRQAFSRRGRYVSLVGRMRGEVSLPAVQAEMGDIARQLETEMPEFNSDMTATAGMLRTDLAGDAVPVLLLLGAAVSVLLLVGSANVANLLLARTLRREREMALRAALGASRIRLASQLMIESGMLFAVGGVGGAAAAAAAIRMIGTSNSFGAFRLEQLALNLPTVAISIAVAAGVGVLIGIAPAFHARRSRLARHLGTRSSSSPVHRLADALVIGQVGLAVALVTGSLLLGRTVVRLQHVDPGFRYHDLVKVDLQLPETTYPTSMETYPDWPEIQAFYRTLLERVQTVAGIDAAALGWHHPLETPWGGTRFSFDASIDDGGEHRAGLNGITPSYLDVVGMQLLSGRGIRAEDTQRTPPVAIVNQAFAARFGTREPFLGTRISMLGRSYEVVGVVGDVRSEGIHTAPTPVIYPPLTQMPSEWFSLLVRLEPGAPASLVAALRESIWEVDPTLPLDGLESIAAIRDRQLRGARMRAAVIGLFALTSGVLATIGIVGVLGYHVDRRRREIGIRMALGAKQSQILRRTVGRGLALTAVGILTGLGPAAIGARVAESFFHGIEPWDPLSFLAAPLLLVTAAAAAAMVPALRAASVPPVEAFE